jgi:hypothetical protein
MSNILKFNQFREEYVIEHAIDFSSSTFESISNLKYLKNRYNFQHIDESSVWDKAVEGWSAFANAFEDYWGISPGEVAHTVVDVVSIAADFIVPGAGAAIDIYHGLAYFVEAALLSESSEKKTQNIVLGCLTLAFAFPGFNPFQAIFASLKLPFTIISKWWKATPTPTPAQAADIAEFFKGNKKLKEVIEVVTDKLDDVEKWFGQKIKNFNGSQQGNKFLNWLQRIWNSIKGARPQWLKKMMNDVSGTLRKGWDTTKNFFIGLRRWIDGPVTGGIGKRIFRKGVKVSFYIAKFLTYDSIKLLFKGMTKLLPKMPKTKKIQMFDDIFEQIHKEQSSRGVLREIGKDIPIRNIAEARAKAVFKNDDMIVLSVNKGSDKAKVILRGSGPAHGTPMYDELIQTYRADFQKKLADGKISRTYMSGRPIPQSSLARMEEEYAKTLTNSSTIKEVNKSDFLAGYYKNVEKKFQLNAGLKSLVATGKFLLAGLWTSEKSSTTDSEGNEEEDIDPNVERTLSQEEADELVLDFERQGWDYDPDIYSKTIDEVLDEEERKYISDPVDYDPVNILQEPAIKNVNFAVMIALKTVYSDIEIPSDDDYVPNPFPYIEQFQKDQGLRDNGELNIETLEKLIEITTDEDSKDYLITYLETIEEDDEDSEDRNKKRKEKKGEEKEEKKGRRRILRFLETPEDEQ